MPRCCYSNRIPGFTYATKVVHILTRSWAWVCLALWVYWKIDRCRLWLSYYRRRSYERLGVRQLESWNCVDSFMSLGVRAKIPSKTCALLVQLRSWFYNICISSRSTCRWSKCCGYESLTDTTVLCCKFWSLIRHTKFLPQASFNIHACHFGSPRSRR